MTTLLPPPRSVARRVGGALLRSPLGSILEELTYPHGTDRYLELADPLLARDRIRAVVTSVRRETPSATTLTLRPRRWDGHRAGQYVQVTVEIDGRRHTRCFSISSSEHRGDGQFTITVNADPDGIVSPHLAHRTRIGDVVEVTAAEGEFVLPGRGREPLVLISGGSGITPMMSMLQTLADEGSRSEVVFLHYARTRTDLIFADQLSSIGASLPGLRQYLVFTREPGHSTEGLSGHLQPQHLDLALADEVPGPTFVCGPSGLIDSVTDLFEDRGLADTLHVERFHLGADSAATADATGDVTFAETGVVVANDGRPVLDQAEDAGLTPQAGCRMGICHTCIRPKISGQVRDVRDGRLSSCDPEDVQICISAPVGDVTIDL